MRTKLNYYWRIVGTGIAFASIGIGGLLLALTLLPLIHCFPNSRAQNSIRAQYLIHRSFHYYVKEMCWLGLMKVSVEGQEHIQNIKSGIIIANHPTLFDVVLLISLFPKANCIVKEALWRNPFLRGVVKATGYIRNSLSPDELIQACQDSFGHETPLIIFPEGTRSVKNKPLSFQRGAANIAIRTACDIMPVYISCQPTTLAKGEKWYQVPEKKVDVKIKICPVLDVSTIIREKPSSLAARHLTAYLQNMYQQDNLINANS